MKVALITGGQPRFTPDFLKVLSQLKGFDSADLYLNLWESPWALGSEQGVAKLHKILPPHINLKRLQILKEPERQLNSTATNFSELKWWYDRRIGQIHSLKLAFDLINEDYDVIVRFRPDGSLTSDLDISTLDVASKEVIFCDQLMGVNRTEPNDQVFVGTQGGIGFLCNLYNEFDKCMIESCPDWENDVHRWALEYIIGTYFKLNNKPIHRGSFNYIINSQGKSAYTDKHHHVSIAPDPTE